MRIARINITTSSTQNSAILKKANPPKPTNKKQNSLSSSMTNKTPAGHQPISALSNSSNNNGKIFHPAALPEFADAVLLTFLSVL